MLSRNYSDWRRYLDRLLSANFKEDLDISEELNRLILNYLTLAYSAQEHFPVSLKQRFRNNAKKLQEYDDFVERLSKASWAFAFILDYRGYVQHAGLAVRRNNRVASETSIRIEVVVDAKTLLADKRQWERSRLTAVAKLFERIENVERVVINEAVWAAGDSLGVAKEGLHITNGSTTANQRANAAYVKFVKLGVRDIGRRRN